MTRGSGWGILAGIIAVALIGGAVGYAIGAPNSEDAERIRKRNERVNTLKSKVVIVPVSALNKTQHGYPTYTEAVSCYLSGAPNGAVDNMVKVLEITLRKKYEEVEAKPVPAKHDLYKLIEWAQKYLKSNKDIAHAFRIKRNLIHYDATITEDESLATIIHISMLLNILYPYDTAYCYYTCQACRRQEYSPIQREQYYLGNSIQVRCANNPTSSFPVLINQ